MAAPTRRERQALQTRTEILQAARRLFAERGYAQTGVRDVAEAAGVSAQTVYDSVGPKQALVARLNDLIDEEAGIGAIAGESRTSTDAAFVAGTSARVTRSILESCGDIARALVSGAAAEAELAGVLEEGRRRHLDGARGIAQALAALDALAPGLDPEAAAQTMAVLSDVAFGLTLLDAYGWSPEAMERWVADTTCRAVLAGWGPVRS